MAYCVPFREKMLYDRMEVMIRGGMKLSVCVLQMDVVPGKAGI